MLNHSLVITVYNASKDVALCLQSLEYSIDFNTVEVVIVDDASEIETQQIVDNFLEKFPQIKLIRHTENKGYLHSVNEGISNTTKSIITLLNSDTYIPCHFTSRILDCFAKDEKIGIASPILTHGNPFSIPLSKNTKQVYDEMTLPILIGYINDKAKNIIPYYPDIAFPDGACFSIRRQCLEKIGVFKEEYAPGYFEELDFCMRAVKAGFRTVFMENLYVYHKSHASFGKKKTAEYMKRNKARFYEDWGNEYKQYAHNHPKKKHKKRVFCCFYSLWYYFYVEGLLKFSRIIPVSSVRRKIRALYQ